MYKMLGRLTIPVLLLSLRCCFAVEEDSREFKLINLSGCQLDLYSIDGDERQLREEAILNATAVTTEDIVGKKYEVVASNCSEICADCSSSFQVNDSFDQLVWVEEGFFIFQEDDLTKPFSYRLNSDFSLFYEMNSLSSVDELFEDSFARYRWQARLFRTSPVFGLIENKLLCHSLLVAMGIPKAEIYYGGFATKAMSVWPQYDRDDFIETLKNTPPVAQDHLFVVKPATGSFAEDVLVMNDKKWADDGWNLERLADYVESILNVSESMWGANYEHIGVLVQQSVLPQEANTDIGSGAFDENAVFEMKAHVVFGELTHTGLIPVPHNIDAAIYFSFCEGDSNLLYATNSYGANSHLWEIVKPTIQTKRLWRIARRLTHVFGADWFRLDVFMDLNGMFLVNEVTYPSSFSNIWDCSLHRLYNIYNHAALDILEPKSVLEPLLKQINVTYELFTESSDYQNMQDTWSEDDWDSYFSNEEEKSAEGTAEYNHSALITDRPYRIVNAPEGGWPSSLFEGPFVPGEEVHCHIDMTRCRSGEGVDVLFGQHRRRCDVVGIANVSHVHLSCDGDKESGMMPIKCCERFHEGDSPVLTTPQGLFHYATWGDGPRTVVFGMKKLESTCAELQKSGQSGKQPMLLYYRNDENAYSENSNIPLRVQKSLRYEPIYRTLLRADTDVIESKWDAAILADDLGLNVRDGPFPVTYFSYEAALQSTNNASTQFYIKPAWESWGRGIEVKTRAELLEQCESGACEDTNGEVIIQEAITDLTTIGGCRFDIRFYILVNQGRIFLHETGVVTWPPALEYNASSSEQASSFARKYLMEYDEENDLLNTFLTSTTKGEGKRWMDAIYRRLVEAIPFIGPVARVTEGDVMLYQIFGGDAMIRGNGDAVITEFNDYPWVDWSHGLVTSLDEDGIEVGERSHTKGKVLYEETVSTMFADFFAIVMGLADTTPCLHVSSNTESCPFILDGRVREVIPEASAASTKAAV